MAFKQVVFSGSLLACCVSSFAHAATPDASALVGPIAEYKMYVMEEVNQYVTATKAFTDAVKKGDINTAKKLYAPARQHYERIEPVAELFSDLDKSMDSREDDYEHGAKDPAFVGFHRLEKALWADNSTKGMESYADHLANDTLELQKRLSSLPFPPNKVVGGAASLIEEVAATKISGEEDRYSRTDLWDFQANVDGAQKIVDLFRPLLKTQNQALLSKIDQNLATVHSTLAKYRSAKGFESYEKLTDADRNKLKGPITALAEDLSQLRGVLGLN
jgi:iron uptake system component EfeO